MKYFVDWSDPSFPKICQHDPTNPYTDPITLGEAKNQIISHFEGIRDHAREQIAAARSLRASDITEGEA